MMKYVLQIGDILKTANLKKFLNIGSSIVFFYGQLKDGLVACLVAVGLVQVGPDLLPDADLGREAPEVVVVEGLEQLGLKQWSSEFLSSDRSSNDF